MSLGPGGHLKAFAPKMAYIVNLGPLNGLDWIWLPYPNLKKQKTRSEIAQEAGSKSPCYTPCPRNSRLKKLATHTANVTCNDPRFSCLQCRQVVQVYKHYLRIITP